MPISGSSEEFQRLESTKLVRLREELGKRDRGVKSNGHPAPDRGSHLSSADFAELLYRKAPEDFLTGTSVETLARISEESEAAYRELLGGRNLVVKVFNHPEGDERFGRTSIISAIEDQPFIIDSFNELLRCEQLHHFVLLHPIVVGPDGRHTSIVYADISKIDDPQKLSNLQAEFESVLQNLTSVRQDTPAMLVHVETVARMVELGMGTEGVSEADRLETAHFLRWLADGFFVFLGYQEFTVSSARGSSASNGSREQNLQIIDSSSLGLFSTKDELFRQRLSMVEQDVRFAIETDRPIFVSKLLVQSPVHRRTWLDVVTVRSSSIDQQSNKFCCFLGVFSSSAITQEASATPVLRRKLWRILESEGVILNSYDHKEIVSLANGLPKSELFLYDLAALHNRIWLIMSMQRRNEVRVAYDVGPLNRIVSLMVAMPRERYSDAVRSRVQRYVEAELGALPYSSEYRLTVSDSPLLIIHFSVPNQAGRSVAIDPEVLTRNIRELTFTWQDHVLEQLVEKFGTTKAAEHQARYTAKFPEHYKSSTAPKDTVADIERLARLNESNPVDLTISTVRDDSQSLYELRLYRVGEILSLSEVLPVLENAGFHVINENVTPLISGDVVESVIYSFRIRLRRGLGVPLGAYNNDVIAGLRQILCGEVVNDRLNALLVDPGLSCREIAVIRTIVKYTLQIKAVTSLREIITAVTDNPSATRILITFWRAKFNPSSAPNSDERERQLKDLPLQFAAELKKIKSLTADRALRTLWNIVEATVRTNYYQDQSGYRVAIKIACGKVRDMPKPVPFAEIFVASPQFEGVHLRGGRVARGGLRWSDRLFDFRTEILGLMKTQMVKNSIIVPTGAKGGFVLNNRPEDPAALKAHIEECYRLFIRSLLELTDNRDGENIIHPPQTIIYDEPDPYFVVAADRGTATFSDIANSIAVNDFNFWLGDAFASGGSNGYDHKKYAITAKGAWEAVNRHFREIGIDYRKMSFTVVGIGDLAGDVFGNGLIASDKIKLLAAFNHKHVFVDPNPDPEQSYVERKRLFDLPGSQWSDYRQDLLSPGGAIFSRDAKEIELSEQAQAALGIHKSVLTPNELIKGLLSAPVDLLWNGGIGTFVKASSEDNINVGDRANDEIRLNGKDLRVKVVGEGGNLGFTQLARIEYSKIGGHINVDAVDNSGGVNLSDIEVNLKIALRQPVMRGELSLEERNKLIASCATEVCQKVLDGNSSQSRSISLAVRHSRKHLDEYIGLMADLERRHILDRVEANLPDEEAIKKRFELKTGLTRPELAVLLGHAKIATFDEILNSPLPEYPYVRRYVLDYFPEPVRAQFKNDVLNHPLRREIIASQLTNLIMDRMGITFVHRTAAESGAEPWEIIFSFIIADALVDGAGFASRLAEFDTSHNNKIYLSAVARVGNAIEALTKWVLEHREQKATITEILGLYHAPFQRLLDSSETLGEHSELNRHSDAAKQLVLNGMPQDLAERVVTVGFGPGFLDIATIAIRTQQDVIAVAKMYFAVTQRLHIRALLEKARSIEASSRWDSLAIRTIESDIRKTVSSLVDAVIRECGSASEESLQRFLGARVTTVEKLERNIREIDSTETSLSALLVLSNQLLTLTETSL